MKKANPPTQKSTNTMSRRSFLSTATTAAVGFTIVPRHVLGGTGFVSPSDKVNIACIAVGGKGRSDTFAVSTENIVALCDVDDRKMAEFKELCAERDLTNLFEKANKYRDFREMLEKEKSIDAVTISTPDHTHAVIAMMAMKHGKHVFCQKPLTHTIYEARKLAETAKETGVITQMGNQGHAGEGGRLICEWIWDGAIGDVTEVHAWTNRPIWPQGIERPQEIPAVPDSLDWNLWLGPVVFKPYHPDVAHFNWRGWWDYGTGALGDMGAHIIDHAYWPLKLKHPTSVQATSTPFTEDSYPMASLVTYEFPARGDMPPVTMRWYDGGLKPPRPNDLEEGRLMGDKGGGVIFVGTKGKIMCSVYGRNPRLIPETKMREYKRPEKTIPRSPGIHEEWIEAIKAGKKSTTDFSYAGPLTETMLLGNVAIRTQEQNTKLLWEPENMKITNLDEANEFLHCKYRPGWTL